MDVTHSEWAKGNQIKKQKQFAEEPKPWRHLPIEPSRMVSEVSSHLVLPASACLPTGVPRWVSTATSPGLRPAAHLLDTTFDPVSPSAALCQVPHDAWPASHGNPSPAGTRARTTPELLRVYLQLFLVLYFIWKMCFSAEEAGLALYLRSCLSRRAKPKASRKCWCLWTPHS